MYLKDGDSETGDAAAPIVAKATDGTPHFNINLATTGDNAGLVTDSRYIQADNLFGDPNTGFIKNYLYPAFLFKCTGADDETVGFAVEGTVGTGDSAVKYYQTFECTVKGETGARGDGTDATLLAHDSLAELNADASNRLVASTI